jgi:hypothetical protein
MVLNKNKKNMLIFFTVSPKSIRMLSCQAYIIHEYAKEYNIVYVATGKTNRTLTYYEQDAKLPFLDTNVLYLGKDVEGILSNPGKNTYEYYSKNNIVKSELEKYEFIPDVIVNWGQAAVKNMTMKTIREVYKTSKYQTFASTTTKIFPLYIMYEFLKNNPDTIYFEHSIDPIFLSFKPDVFGLTNKMFYTHEHSFDYFQRFDAYQYYLLKNKPRIDTFKDINFVFGMTAIADKYRIDLAQKLKEILQDEEHYYYYISDPKNNIKENILIPRPDYNKLISRAKYTFIIPAYIEGAFSITRLCDAIYDDCCPIFDSNCYFEVLEKDFDIDLDKIKPLFLVVTKDGVILPDDENREDLIEYLYDKLFNNLKLKVFEEKE